MRRYEVFPAQAIHMLLKIPATRTPQGALKFVALIIKILSCNKNFFFMVYDQNYHNCSTLNSGKQRSYNFYETSDSHEFLPVLTIELFICKTKSRLVPLVCKIEIL
jgi:hypothetical protein